MQMHHSEICLLFRGMTLKNDKSGNTLIFRLVNFANAWASYSGVSNYHIPKM